MQIVAIDQTDFSSYSKKAFVSHAL